MELDQLPLIRWIPPHVRRDVLVIRRVPEGARLFEQHEPTTGLWIVIEGRVAVERVATDGTVTTTGVWVRGDIVGIAGLWDRSGYPAAARALDTPTVMGWIARDVVLQLHQEIPQFGLEVSRLLAERLRFVQETIAARQGRPMINQVATVLLTLTTRLGPVIVLTHEDIAHIIGTHRETVTRALQELARHGAIRLKHGSIEILAIPELEAWTVSNNR